MVAFVSCLYGPGNDSEAVPLTVYLRLGRQRFIAHWLTSDAESLANGDQRTPSERGSENAKCPFEPRAKPRHANHLTL